MKSATLVEFHGKSHIENEKPPQKNTIQAEMRTVTPAMASAWLETQAHNRKWRRETVNKYKAEMLSGMWQENGEPIILNSQGALVDGQHRLRAIVEGNCSVKMLVVSGIKSQAAMTIDMGLSRTLGDVFVMNGLRNARLLSRTSKLLYIWNTRFNEISQRRSLSKDLVNAHPQQVYAYYLRHQVDIDRACAEYKNHTPLTANVRGAVLAFIFSTLEKINTERCYIFMGCFTAGNIPSTWPYMLKIRDALLSRKKQSTIRLTETERISLIFGVWNVIYHKTGTEEVESNTLNIPLELLKK